MRPTVSRRWGCPAGFRKDVGSGLTRGDGVGESTGLAIRQPPPSEDRRRQAGRGIRRFLSAKWIRRCAAVPCKLLPQLHGRGRPGPDSSRCARLCGAAAANTRSVENAIQRDRSCFESYYERRDTRVIPEVLRVAGPPAGGELVADTGRGPHAAAHQRGHGPVQTLLLGRGDAPEPAHDDLAEVLPHRRHRRGRRRHPPDDVRDAGQLQLRRLLQGRGHGLRGRVPGVGDGSAEGELRRDSARWRRRGLRPVAETRHPRGAHLPVRRRGQLVGAPNSR